MCLRNNYLDYAHYELSFGFLSDCFDTFNQFRQPEQEHLPFMMHHVIIRIPFIMILLVNITNVCRQRDFHYDTLVWLDSKVPMFFIHIPPGEFLMGSREDEPGRDPDEGPIHTVLINTPFYMSVFEVTQEQFTTVMGYNPSSFSVLETSAQHPVETVTWNEAVAFIDRLNARGKGKFRLPTEAEWEYSCRAETKSTYYWGDEMMENGESEYTWANSRSFARTHPVGEKKSNPWGLYDMSGNVWEWCSDWYGPYSPEQQTEPAGPGTGKNKVFRGGSWYDFYESHRCANRHRHSTNKGYTAIGFRVVLETD